MDLIIGKPYYEKTGDEKSVKLCSRISGIINKVLYYSVDEKWAEYFCDERSDAFLLALLPFALSRSTEDDILSVYCEMPVSEKLYYQLNRHFIPTVIRNIDWCSNINIVSELDNSLFENSKAVGTGISGGG